MSIKNERTGKKIRLPVFYLIGKSSGESVFHAKGKWLLDGSASARVAMNAILFFHRRLCHI